MLVIVTLFVMQGTAVAVKRLLAADAATGHKFVSEIKILARLRHPNLVGAAPGCMHMLD